MGKDKHKRRHPAHEEPPEGAPSEPAGEASAPDPAEVEQLREQSQGLLARLQRVSADYQNYQKRTQRDVAEARKFANAELIKALLPVLDDMERVLAAAKENHGHDDPLYVGMQLVHDKAMETLGKFGLSRIEAKGRPFDPDKHAALAQRESREHPPQTVVEEMIKGYELKGRTLRPAGVVVSAPPEADLPSEETPQGETPEQDDE